jgi:hypothetical protein
VEYSFESVEQTASINQCLTANGTAADDENKTSTGRKQSVVALFLSSSPSVNK